MSNPKTEEIRNLLEELYKKFGEFTDYRKPEDVALLIQQDKLIRRKDEQIRQFKSHTRSIIKILKSQRTKEEKTEMITEILKAMGGSQ